MEKLSDTNIRDYLLERAAEPDAEVIDLRLIDGDADLAAELERATDELIEEYLDGRLPDEDREAFRVSFIACESRNDKIEENLMLRRYASENAAEVEPRPSIEPARSGLFERLLRPAFAIPIFAALLLMIGYFALVRDGRSPLEREYAAMNQTGVTNIDGGPLIALAPGAVRGDSGGVSIERMAGPRRFGLALPSGAGPDVVYSLELTAGGKTFRLDGLRASPNGTASDIKVTLPGELLTPGSARIELSSDGRPVASYIFTVK